MPPAGTCRSPRLLIQRDVRPPSSNQRQTRRRAGALVVSAPPRAHTLRLGCGSADNASQRQRRGNAHSRRLPPEKTLIPIRHDFVLGISSIGTLGSLIAAGRRGELTSRTVHYQYIEAPSETGTSLTVMSQANPHRRHPALASPGHHWNSLSGMSRELAAGSHDPVQQSLRDSRATTSRSGCGKAPLIRAATCSLTASLTTNALLA